MTDWYHDRQATVGVTADDRGLRYGDGLFETLAIRNGKLRLWEYHFERLTNGCRKLGLHPPEQAALLADLEHALTSSGAAASDAVVRVILTAGDGSRGYRRDDASEQRLLIGVSEAVALAKSCYRHGVVIIRCETTVAEQPSLAGMKTLNRLEQVLARREWRDTSIFDGLMCDKDARVICGTMSNVFVVRNESIMTPDLARAGVAGVMRRHVVTLAQATAMPVQEADIACKALESADELFLSNSQIGVVPVCQYGNRQWSVGPVTSKIMDLLADNGVPECRP